MTHDRLLTHEFQATFGQKQPTYADLIKEALLEKSAETHESVATFSPAMDKSPALKGKQSKLPDNIQAAILRKKLKSSKEKTAALLKEAISPALKQKAARLAGERVKALEAASKESPKNIALQRAATRRKTQQAFFQGKKVPKLGRPAARVAKHTEQTLTTAGKAAKEATEAGKAAKYLTGTQAAKLGLGAVGVGAAAMGARHLILKGLKAKEKNAMIDNELLNYKTQLAIAHRQENLEKVAEGDGATFSPEAAKKYLPKQASVQHEAFFDELSAIQKEAVVGALGGALRGGASAIRQGGKQFFGGQGTAKGIGQSIKGATQKGWQTGAKQQRQAGKMISSGQQAHPVAQKVIGSHRRNLAAGGAAAGGAAGLMGYGAYKAVT